MKIRYLALSLILHTSLILGFVFFRFESNPKSEAISVEVVEPPKAPLEHSKPSSPNRVVQGKSHKVINPFLWNPSAKMAQKEEKSNLGLQGHPAPEWAERESYSQDALTDYDGISAEEVKFIKTLRREIDQSIVDNPYLSEYGHFGNVFMQFEISSEGQMVENSFKAQAEDPILKVLAARAIRKALKNENLEIHFLGKPITFGARFLWSSYENCPSFRGQHQHYLSFCRYAEDKRKSFSTAEKVGTYIKALQHGFSAIDDIKEYNREENHKKLQFNPFQELENDPDYSLGS